jgi:hypothetical protein
MDGRLMTLLAGGRYTAVMIRWSPLTEFFFYFGVLCHAAYLSEPGKRLIGLWPLVAVVVVPFTLLRFFQRGEHADDTVKRAQLWAALWYLTLTAIAVALAVGGYRPADSRFFLAGMAPGAVISLLCVRSQLRDPPAPQLPLS